MTLPWVGRQLIVFVLLAIVLVVVSGFLELIGAVRQSTEQAQVETELIAGNVRRQLERIIETTDLRSIKEIGQDPRLEGALMDALVLAPSMLHVAIVAPSGIVVAHTMPSRVGTIEPAHPGLPESRSLRDSGRTLWQLLRTRQAYQKEYPVTSGDAPLATIRIVIGGTFLWDAVKEAASRGMWTAIVVIGLAIGAGLLLGRFSAGRIRLIERGITALSEGRYDTLPESGVDEFARLARALNVLGARLAEGTPARTGASSADSPRDADLVLLEGQTRAIAHLGEAAAGVAHEIGNQLQAVELDLSVLQQAAGREPEKMRRHVESAARGVASVNGAVRGFLKIARLRPPSPRLIHLNDLVTRIKESFVTEAGLAGVGIDLDLDRTMPETMADPEVLTQAVQNVIRNALQALSASEDGRIVLRTSRSGGNLRITIQDNGAGIRSEVREKIFDLFFTTRTDGSGVGLALVKQSIEMHGGQVLIDSAEGKGTAVTLEIPWSRAS